MAAGGLYFLGQGVRKAEAESVRRDASRLFREGDQDGVGSVGRAR